MIFNFILNTCTFTNCINVIGDVITEKVPTSFGDAAITRIRVLFLTVINFLLTFNLLGTKPTHDFLIYAPRDLLESSLQQKSWNTQLVYCTFDSSAASLVFVCDD